MTGASKGDAFAFQVTDFGPIVKATLTLRPLTVFLGPSNTGKSYLAILLYALQRFFTRAGFSRRYFRAGYGMSPQRGVLKNPQLFLDSLAEMLHPLLDASHSSARDRLILPATIADGLCASFDMQGPLIGREIRRCFGIEKESSLSRKGRKSVARIVLHQPNSHNLTPSEHTLMLSARQTEFKTTIPAAMSIQVNANKAEELLDLAFQIAHLRSLATERQELPDEHRYGVNRLFALLGEFLLPHVAGPMCFPAYYLPTDRTGVMHAHSVVVSALIGSAPTAGLRPATRTPMLSGVLADFLEQLIEIDQPRYSRRKRQHDLGASIEKTILGGSIKVDRSIAIDYPRFTYRPDGWKNDLPLMNASSMVSELAPVVLYLRHKVAPGHVLIVEEPESHLHPAMQVKFTRQLAMLVQAGVRVIVTTHSEWLLEELANIVQRSALPKSQDAKKKGDEIALRPDQVGAWLFEPKLRPKGSVVSEISLGESGLYPSGFDDVAAALHNDWAELSSRIEDGA